MNYIEKIHEYPVFSGIRKEELEPMLKCLGSHVRKYEKGEFISFEQEEVKNVGVLISGAVHMVKEDIWGNHTIVTRVEEGQLFGETFACGTDNQSVVSYMAAEKCEVLFMGFSHILHTCPSACRFHQKLIENMVLMLANKNKALMDKIEVVSKKSLREKILSYLSQEAQKAGSRYFEIPLGRVELAHYLAADRSALTRELSAMKKEGILDFDRNLFRLY